MSAKLTILLAIQLVFFTFLVMSQEEKKSDVPVSRTQQVLNNLTKSVSDISDKLKLMRGILNETEFKEPIEFKPTNTTYQELIERVQLARDKVKEMSKILEKAKMKLGADIENL